MKINVKTTNNISKFINNLKRAEGTIVKDLLDIGEKEAENNILKGYEADGNTSIYLDSVTAFNGGKLSINGDDVAYQEFGYGQPAQTNLYPKLPPGYYPSDKNNWIYYDDSTGKFRVSNGMPPQMPMYKAGKKMRNSIKYVIKKRLPGIK